MSDPRWITAEEIQELIERALYLLKVNGYTYEGAPGGKLVEAKLNVIRVVLDDNKTVHVYDLVAQVMVFDFDTRGVRELYGSTARNALLALRVSMVLDDFVRV